MAATFPASVSNPNTAFPALKLEPQDTSCVIVLSGTHKGMSIKIEASQDGGSSGNWPWSPVAALRESTLKLDNFESAVSLTENGAFTWRVDCLTPGSSVRVTVVATGTGTLTMNARSGRFFLDSPVQLTVSAEAAGSSDQVWPYATSDEQAGSALPMEALALQHSVQDRKFGPAAADYLHSLFGMVQMVSVPQIQRQNARMLKALLMIADLLLYQREPAGAQPAWGHAAEMLDEQPG